MTSKVQHVMSPEECHVSTEPQHSRRRHIYGTAPYAQGRLPAKRFQHMADRFVNGGRQNHVQQCLQRFQSCIEQIEAATPQCNERITTRQLPRRQHKNGDGWDVQCMNKQSSTVVQVSEYREKRQSLGQLAQDGLQHSRMQQGFFQIGRQATP